MASSSISGSTFDSSRPWIFLCFVPMIICSISRSPDSVVSLNLHFVAWFRHRDKKSSFFSSDFCLNCCSWNLENRWLTFGATCFLNHSQIFPGFFLSSLFAHVQLLKHSMPCLPIQNRMSEGCSFSDFFENGPVNMRLQYCSNFASSSARSLAFQFILWRSEARCSLIPSILVWSDYPLWFFLSRFRHRVVLCSKHKRLENSIRCANKSGLYSAILNHMNAMKNMPAKHSAQNVIESNVAGNKFDSI